jgi:ABC-type polysaccharide/polyol phosphate export permease
MEHLVGVGLSAWFFMSPVMYNLSFLAQITNRLPWVLDVYMLNPLAVIITAYRALTLNGVAFPLVPSAVGSFLFMIVVFAGSIVAFQRMQRSFADIL